MATFPVSPSATPSLPTGFMTPAPEQRAAGPSSTPPLVTGIYLEGPYVNNRDPIGPVCVDPETAVVTFDVRSFLPLTIDLPTFTVEVEVGAFGPLETVYTSGAFDPAYSGSTTNNATATEDVESFSFTRVAGWPELSTFTVFVSGSDSGATPITPTAFWSWCSGLGPDQCCPPLPPPVVDGPPFLVSSSPANGAVDQDPGVDIAFTITDLETGVELPMVNVDITYTGSFPGSPILVPAVVKGVIEPNYIGVTSGVTPNGLGYDFILDFQEMVPLGTLVTVGWSAEDTLGNPGSGSFSFRILGAPELPPKKLGEGDGILLASGTIL
jgi:hypothetical protein